MNRLKLWLYVVLLLGAGAGNLYFLTGWISARSVAHIDRELRAGAAVADARVRLLAASAAALADAAARAPTVVAAMADPAASPLGPAEDAVASVRAVLDSDDARRGLVAVAGPQGASARAGGAEGDAIAVPEALLAEAQAGRRGQAWTRLDGTLWMVAAAPAGRNGAVAVGLPLDGTFAESLRTATGVDVTTVQGGQVEATTAKDGDATALSGLPGATSRRPVNVGRLGSIKAALDWPAPPMPILFADLPAARALAMPLEGAPDATLVLSQRTAPFFSGLATYQLLALVAMALFLLVGVLLGLFMSEDTRAGMPRELVSAAERIGPGDFSARAPALSGSPGKVAAALNRAAEAAHQTGSRPVQKEPPVTAPGAMAGAAVEAAPEATAEETSAAAAAGANDFATTQPIFASSGEPRSDEGERADEAEREAPRAALHEDAGSAIPALGEEPAPVLDAAPEHHAALAPEAAPGAAAEPPPAQDADQPVVAQDADEPHWQKVYAEFVRLRSETGEPADSLPYDRFRARLERNREQLRDKHHARTVRFQPYLKEGKVALRATPVK